MDRTATRSPHRAGLVGAALSLTVLLASGCGIDTQEYGNVVSDCPAGTNCTCGSGNCVMSCLGGGCDLTCTGTSNCDFDCAGGGCTVTCENVGNCVTACAGDGCDVTCTNVGNCVLSDCSTACTLTCANTGNCL